MTGRRGRQSKSLHRSRIPVAIAVRIFLGCFFAFFFPYSFLSPTKTPRTTAKSTPLQQKVGPFGTVKGSRTNPTVVPDESVNPRLDKVLERVAVGREVIVALVNSNVKDTLEVWFNSIKRLGIHNYLVVALDEEIFKFCVSNDVPVYKRDPDEGIDSTARTGGNHAVSGLKFRILRDFLQLGYSVLL
ncbi:hypothetical protein QYF36_010388 [Acer negundo]|nr:hypothetical protein QYF36_010388 [Acer negundo]